MTKEELRQYRDLIQEEKMLEQELERWDMIQADTVKGSNPHFPFQQKTFFIKGKNTAKYNSCKRLLEVQQKMCIDLRLQIEEFIASIPDSQIRMIFRMRYIQNCTWLEISLKMGATYKEYAQVVHDRYLNKIKTS